MNPLSRLFSALVRDHVSPFLKGKGFSKTGQCFLRESPESWAVIHFQRSLRSDSTLVLFTADIGVASKRVCEFFAIQVEQKNSIDTCQWRQRLGVLLPGEVDRWWSIDAETDIASLGSGLVNSLRYYGLPAIDSVSEDAALRDLWMSGESPGLTRAQRLMNLLILLHSIGPHSNIRPIEQELRELVSGRAVEHKANWVMNKLVSVAG